MITGTTCEHMLQALLLLCHGIQTGGTKRAGASRKFYLLPYLYKANNLNTTLVIWAILLDRRESVIYFESKMKCYSSGTPR